MRTSIIALLTLTLSTCAPTGALAQEIIQPSVRSGTSITYVPNTINWSLRDRPWVERSTIAGHDVVRRGPEWTFPLIHRVAFVTDTTRTTRIGNTPRVRHMNMGFAFEARNSLSFRGFMQSGSRIRRPRFMAGFVFGY